MSQFLSLANSRDLRLHEDIQTRSCAACGSIFVPGVNARVRVVPVQMTKLQREKRKRTARKKTKMERNNMVKGDIMIGRVATGMDDTKMEIDSNASFQAETTATTMAPAHSVPTQKQQETLTPPQPVRKVIRMTTYTEQNQQQQQRRQSGHKPVHGALGKSIDKRANQLLNHVVYSCLRCHQDTELPGSKEGYLNSRIKTRKPISQRRKMKQAKQAACESSTAAILSSTTSLSTSSVPNTTPNSAPNITPLKKGITPLPVNVHPKRPASPLAIPALSVATSPSPSQQLDSSKPSSGSKKKKKSGLTHLLASQKAKDPSSDSSGGATGSGGDSVLANFLMGL
ncbi:hypothetical protein BGZ65_000814 [Modicella reniformis]|uniref:Uncharacterized protein n=1 Tax=Modicella reniformis TaxID=1440133 RepID=A0A9P6J4G7_9FUNG|nr:hypothetical protein BGZ65_000814 [Modicella reniformis]